MIKNYILEQFQFSIRIFWSGHASIVHTPHANSIYRFVTHGFLHPIIPVCINLIFVYIIPPFSRFLAILMLIILCPFKYIVTQHRFTMTATYNDCIIIGYLRILFIIIEGFGTGMHCRPYIISLEPQHQFKHFGIRIRTNVFYNGVHMLSCPGLQAPIFIINKDATILNRRRRRSIRTGNMYLISFSRCNIGPPYKRRYSH